MMRKVVYEVHNDEQIFFALSLFFTTVLRHL